MPLCIQNIPIKVRKIDSVGKEKGTVIRIEKSIPAMLDC